MSVIAQVGEQARERLSRREMQYVLLAEQVETLARTMTEQTQNMAKLVTGLLNDMLEVSTIVIGADGWVVKDWPVPVGAALVDNLSSDTEIVVTTAGPSVSLPTDGIGVTVVLPGVQRPVHLASRMITIYGPVGGRIGLQAFTGGLRTGSGAGIPGVVDGGGA